MKSYRINLFLVAASVIGLVVTGGTAWAQMMGHQGMMRGGCCRMMDVTVGAVAPADLPEPDSPGAAILKERCTQCHGLVTPRQNAADDWPPIVERMDARMRMMGGMGMMRSRVQGLSPTEKMTLVAYLQNNALPSLSADNVPEGNSPEAKTFVTICSRCHAVPDPKAHTASEWEGVVARMANNMQSMGYGELTKGNQTAIISYLKRHASR